MAEVMRWCFDCSLLGDSLDLSFKFVQTINWVAQDGIPFILNNSFEGGATILYFQCMMGHGLQPGEYIELSFDYSGDKIF